MTEFVVHSRETAPEQSKLILEKIQELTGFVPEEYGVLAEAPVAVKAYDQLASLFKATSLSTTEQHVVLLTITYEYDCTYCMPAHTALAMLDRVPGEVIVALRNGTVVADARLEALRCFTAKLIAKNGWVAEEDVQSFLDAGYSKQQVLEVIVGIACKTVSKYTNHIAGTAVDEAFARFLWTKPIDHEAA